MVIAVVCVARLRGRGPGAIVRVPDAGWFVCIGSLVVSWPAPWIDSTSAESFVAPVCPVCVLFVSLRCLARWLDRLPVAIALVSAIVSVLYPGRYCVAFLYGCFSAACVFAVAIFLLRFFVIWLASCIASFR